MVSRVLVAALLMSAVSAWGGQQRQLCLSCHLAHYVERGRCSGCHLGNSASDRKNIAHVGIRAGKYARFTIGNSSEAKAGEHLMGQFACRRCHVSGGRGNHLAVSLDGAAMRRSAEELAFSIRHPVVNMPNFAPTEEQITTLVNVVLVGSSRRETVGGAPVRVHFNIPGKKSADVFSTKCGSCHRILSQRLGAVGVADIGPNLSGLFSEYYPKTFKNGEVWSARNLRDWLKNPRDIRAWARMRPVVLTETEVKYLETILSVFPELNE